VALKLANVTFSYKNNKFIHKCMINVTSNNKLKLDKPMEELKYTLFKALKRSNYIYKEDLFKKEEDIFNLVSNIDFSLII